MQTSELDCPLCMEPLEIDDVNFYPCTCGYQVCRFCWHRIRTDENGLCPACRKAYSEDPAVYTPLSQDEIQRIIKERKQKDTQRKQKLTENRKHLANVRVVQKNLVFVVGLTQRLADPELLKRTEYFGKFGKIHKIVINNSTNYAGPQGPSASAYITFNKEEDAHKAILAVSNAYLDGRTLKASLGTTKYCSYFLRNIPCPKPDCMYLHDLGDEAASFTKEEMQDGKHQEYEQLLLSNYARKMGVNTDKDSKDLWSGASGSSLPSGSGWGVKDEEESPYSDSPQGERDCSPSFELYNEKNNDNYWEDEDDWEVNEGQQEQTKEATIQAIPSTIPQMIPQTVAPSYQNMHAGTQGWQLETTSQQTLPTDPLLEYQAAPGFFDSGPADSICSLGLTNLHLKVSADDDLGFDPWNESSKGLADLLQEEVTTTCYNPEASVYSTIPTRTAFGSHIQTSRNAQEEFKNWQESFRALLPNININFSGWSTSSEHQPSEWSPATQTTTNIPTTTQKQVVRPPPGFEAKKPDPHVPMVDDPSIVWSKAIGPTTDPIPDVPGRIVTNGYSGASSGSSSTDMPGAVVVKPPGMPSLFHEAIKTSGLPGQSSSSSQSIDLKNSYTSDQPRDDTISLGASLLDNHVDSHMLLTASPIENFATAIEQQRNTGKQFCTSSNGSLKSSSTHFNKKQAHTDRKGTTNLQETGRMFFKVNDYGWKGTKENLKQPHSNKRKVTGRLA